MRLVSALDIGTQRKHAYSTVVPEEEAQAVVRTGHQAFGEVDGVAS